MEQSDLLQLKREVLDQGPEAALPCNLSDKWLYQLVGLPGYCDDAQYVFGNWCRFNRVEVEDATEEFVQHYAISLENMKKLTGKIDT